MNDRPTPETDAVTIKSVSEDDGKYMAEDMLMHARKLERERDEAREQNAAIRDALQTVRDEAFGSSPEKTAMQNIAAIEKGIADMRKENAALRDALRVFDLINAINNPDGNDMPMYVSACQDCGGEYGTPAEGWRAIVRLEYDSIEVAQVMGGSFQEAVTKAIEQATKAR